jgi:hypothetical protein
LKSPPAPIISPVATTAVLLKAPTTYPSPARPPPTEENTPEVNAPAKAPPAPASKLPSHNPVPSEDVLFESQ